MPFLRPENTPPQNAFQTPLDRITYKRLLIGMLASIALVGCTNDDLIENGIEENKKPQAELVRGDAYVNFVINTKTDSSRGTVGDGDGSSDNSGHELAGVREENDVNKLLLIIAKVDDVTEELYGEVKIESVDNVANGYVGYVTPVKDNNTGTYSLATPIRLDYTGKYKVLTVVNPVAELIAAVDQYKNNHKLAYEEVLDFHGKAYEETEGKKSFQMSNKSECVINADPNEGHNKPTTPVVAKINVERTVSKTTWRYNANFTEGVTVPSNLANKPNLYEVKVNVNKAKAEIANYWFKEAMTSGEGETAVSYDAYYFGYKLNKATHTDTKTYWVLMKPSITIDEGGKIDKDDVVAIFENSFFTKAELEVLNSEDKYIGVIDDQTTKWTDDNDNLASLIGSEETAQVLKDDYSKAKERVTDIFIQGLTFVYTMDASTPEYYYVELTHYALTNKTKSAYTVRHIAPAGFTIETMGAPRQLGVLGDNEYLYTPYTDDLNKLSNMAVYANFNNNLDQVNLAAANLKFEVDEDGTVGSVTDATNIFQALPTTGETDGEINAHNSTNVGYFMEYITENSVVAAKQKANTVTGIVLSGKIYDSTGKVVPVLYKYKQKYYRTLRALINDNNSGLKYTENGEEKALTENSTDEQAAAAGIDVYPKGRCFYYSSQIKHFDDGVDTTDGIMEYAIMRNNIYSLAVKSISDIGDADLELTPSTPISDIRSYVQLEVSILPWIVRFNDLEL